MSKNFFVDKNAGSPCPHPSFWFTNKQSLRCNNGKFLTIKDVDFSGKWIIVTGGNSGIGREACIQFAKWGANIILGCRPNPPPKEPHPTRAVEDCKRAAKQAGHLNSTIEWWQVDMASIESIQAFAKKWLDTERPLDVLCNNAGISGGLQQTHYTKDGFELVHQVNLLSHILMTLSLLPSIAKAPEPRILCTTSNMQYLGIFNLSNANAGGDVAYPNNKLYFQTWLTELQVRLARNPKYAHIVVHGVHPGWVATNVWNEMSPENVAKMSWGEYILSKLTPYLAITPQQGSLCITNGASAPELALKNLKPDSKDGIVGARFVNRIWDCVPMPQTRHPQCRKMVWDFVDEELKLSAKGLSEGL